MEVRQNCSRTDFGVTKILTIKRSTPFFDPPYWDAIRWTEKKRNDCRQGGGESVADAPIVSCESSSAHVGDRNVFVRCKVKARPKVTAIFWILDGNGTTVTEGQVVSEHWTLVMVGIVACNRHYGAYTRHSLWPINSNRLWPFWFPACRERKLRGHRHDLLSNGLLRGGIVCGHSSLWTEISTPIVLVGSTHNLPP